MTIPLGPSWCSADARSMAGEREIVGEERIFIRRPFTRFHLMCKVDSIEPMLEGMVLPLHHHRRFNFIS